MARLVATLGLLLTAALLSGCASAPMEIASTETGRTSTAPEEETPMGPTTVVPLSSTDPFVATAGVEHTFGVDVPEDALLVRATLTFRPGVVQDLSLALPDCDLLRVSTASAGTGTVILQGECEPADSGLQQAVLVFEAGSFVGSLAFEAVLPA